MTEIDRRTFVRGAVGAAALASTPAAANTAPDVVDETGKSEVIVKVGVQGNGGPYAFGPEAVRVDPGTTVRWKWTGEGMHNVVAEDGSFESEMLGEAGATFEHTFEETGTSKYVCSPHKSMGMTGVVVVGEEAGVASADGGGAASMGPGELAVGGSFVAALLSPLAFAAFLFARGRDEGATAPETPGRPQP
ncbi:halocyanin domain-containing protein [Halomicrococcus sp. NG-SE-24]|uniref:halocyanin domain-containing protein n=1 Tax=Halomicrococcus sp. NG-SE-24 TaxID=3436928 RepID=UPI003D9690DB